MRINEISGGYVKKEQSLVSLAIKRPNLLLRVIKLFRDQVHCGFLRVFHWDKAIRAALLCALRLKKEQRVTRDEVLEAHTNEKNQQID